MNYFTIGYSIIWKKNWFFYFILFYINIIFDKIYFLNLGYNSFK
jgi:hypothetical protein